MTRRLAIFAVIASLCSVTACDDRVNSNEDESIVKAPPLCGNDHIDAFEACDGNQFSSKIHVDCEKGKHFDAKMLKCDNCMVDTSEACVPNRCGDGLVTDDEECEAGNLATKLIKFGCTNPDLTKLTCYQCKYVDEGVCPAGSEPVEKNKCGNGRLDAGEVCDGGLFAEGARSCPGSRIEIDNPVYKCSSTCTAVDYTNACIENPCGNGKLDAGEQCDGSVFDENALKAIDCGDGKELLRDALRCDSKCMLQEPETACYSDKYIVFSEFVPAIDASHYLEGMAVEITNMAKGTADVSACELVMADGALDTLKTWKFSDYDVSRLGPRDPLVVCIMPEGAKHFGDACDIVVPESDLKTSFASAALLGLKCGDAYVDTLNLYSVSSALAKGGYDFTRHCDALPLPDPLTSVIGDGWEIIVQNDLLEPAYGLGTHCAAEGMDVSDCTYTISRNTLTDRSQTIELTLDVKIPGLTDVSNANDDLKGTLIQFVTSENRNGTWQVQTHHMPEVFADEAWTNDKGYDRYVGTYHNWDTYEGFWGDEQGTYALDARISFDNGVTMTYCGPKGVVTDPTVVKESERNMLTVSYEASRCGNGRIDPGEVCDGSLYIDEITGCLAGKVATDTSSMVCYNCSDYKGKAVCAPKSPACGNGVLDAGEVCDSDKFDEEALKTKCNDEQTYVANRASCNNACKPDLTASCVPTDANVVVDEILVNKRADGSKDLAFVIRNNGEDMDMAECTLAVLKADPTKTLPPIIRMVNFGEIRKTADTFKSCEPIVICSQNVDTEDAMIFSEKKGTDICTANFSIDSVDGAGKTKYTTILDQEDAVYLQITCGGRYVEYVDLDGIRAAADAGMTHAVLGSDKLPWPDYKTSKFSKRMTADSSIDPKTVDPKTFAPSTCK